MIFSFGRWSSMYAGVDDEAIAVFGFIRDLIARIPDILHEEVSTGSIRLASPACIKHYFHAVFSLSLIHFACHNGHEGGQSRRFARIPGS